MAAPPNSTNEALTIKMVERLLECPVGEIVTHAVCERIVGERPYLVQAARRRANDQSGVIFKPVRGVGLRRLPDGEASAVGMSYLAHTRRGANNALRTMENTITKSNSVENHEIVRAYSVMNQIGLIKRHTYARTVDAAEAEIIGKHGSTADAARASLEAMRDALRRRK